MKTFVTKAIHQVGKYLWKSIKEAVWEPLQIKSSNRKKLIN